MEYKIHIVDGEEKLSSIADKYNTTPEAIKALNPHMKTFGGFIGGTFVSYGQKIKIPIKIQEQVNVERKQGDTIPEGEFIKQARYRCRQDNLITIDGTPNFSCELKTQYLFSTLDKEEQKYLNVTLEDYITSIQPQGMQEAFELIKQIELIRNQIIFTQDNTGIISKIHNLGTLENNWKRFLNKEVKNIPFFQELEKRSSDTIKDFIKNGNKEFSSNRELAEVLDKNLFYHILLKANLEDDLKEYTLNQQSQIFPNIKLQTQIVKSIATEDDLTTTYRLVGTLNKENLDEKELLRLYTEMYQPLIKFSYTEFDYIYRITYVIENKTGLLINASASLSEQIKNNYEIITKFELKMIEL
ncbi:LysM domain-containing protein [Apibacter sp. HY039]|uniref:LysM peptidoglycan-binding domain-containing protein n=1 Tax=Apibacter sp. HY039 TaxID=2501476 RepID=UPI000FEB73E4|nr:LysM domain-containing protein [Apibacter sp. HY039]